MYMDGAKFELNDHVWDVALGPGLVVKIDEPRKKVSVKLGSRTMVYDENGKTTFVNRTLFWRDPIFGVLPTKNDDTWTTFTNITKLVSKELLALSRR